ncbi:hypothetical protein D5086_017952 [Populus alba]|uniref:Uncharacterized protein n=1 Tax=Populus alba TaxID=43335 RepID=A0ACC4BPM6_POPAL
MWTGSNPVVSDLCSAVVSAAVIFAFLQLWKETAKHGLDQKLNRKLVHISIGLVFMLCWPIFSSGHRGALFAAFTPGVNIIRMLLIGSGMWKDEATVKSMSRFGDRRELLRGPLYYALTITGACAIYWRTSPVAIAAICNLCAGDGVADIVGRRFGRQKIPYNKNKSIAGSVAMALAGFLASVGFMCYFASFGYVEKSWEMLLGFLVVSLASAFVESLPITSILIFGQFMLNVLCVRSVDGQKLECTDTSYEPHGLTSEKGQLPELSPHLISAELSACTGSCSLILWTRNSW